MKVLAILLCAFVAVQGRSAVSNTEPLAVLGENPYIVHLRVAVSTSGFLETGAGTLLGERWVLTAKSVVEDSRFIWIRYGAVNVINPEMVTEASIVRLNDLQDVALISINRDVKPTANIAPIASFGEASEEAVYDWFTYGANDDGGPGEYLTKSKLQVTRSVNQDEGTQLDQDTLLSTSGGDATRFDLGTPLNVGDVLVGVLLRIDGNNKAVFANANSIKDWVENETGLNLSAAAPDTEEEEEEESYRVNFIN